MYHEPMAVTFLSSGRKFSNAAKEVPDERGVDGTRTLGDIARSFAARSEQSIATVEAQLLDLVDALVARNLLTLDGPEA